MAENTNVQRSTRRLSPEDAVKKLRNIFLLLEEFLNMKEFDQDLRDELSAAHPNYMEVLLGAKRDLLRNDCGIVVAGETSAGKTTLINKITGHKVFVTSNLAATGKVCRIRNSETLEIKTYTKEDKLIKEEKADDIKKLRALIKGLTDVSKIQENEKEIFYVDVYLPVPILKGNVIIVDTPGIGESDQLDQILMDFLPNAVSFVFVVNASNAGGIHEDRLLSILQAVINNRECMPCFDPTEVMFLTNKWDAIENEPQSSDDEDEEDDEHTKTWKLIQNKLRKGWIGVSQDRIFRVSLKQVEKGIESEFTKDYRKFESVLHDTIDNNKNKRVDFYFNFLRQFTQNAERGTLVRLKFLEGSEEEQTVVISRNSKRITDLELKCDLSRSSLNEYKTDVIQELVELLHYYLNSIQGRDEILNPSFVKPIKDVSYGSLDEEIPNRVQQGIHKWLRESDVERRIEDAQVKIRSSVDDIQCELQAIHEDLTGSSIDEGQRYSTTVIALQGLGIIIRTPLLTLFTIVVAMVSAPFVAFKGWLSGTEGHCQKVNEIYNKCLNESSKEKLKESFEKSFGKEYTKVIDRIFDDSFGKVISSCKTTIENLLQKNKFDRQKREEFMNLKGIVQQISKEMDAFDDDMGNHRLEIE